MRGRRCVPWALSIGALIVASAVSFAPSPASAAGTLRIAVPAYYWTSGTWARVAATSEADLVVANPSSGPGGAFDSNYASLINTATGAGKRVVGYVHTNYAKRPMADVLADIAHYRSWYGLNGFFLDEVPWSCADPSLSAYYASIATSVRAQPSPYLVLNPGGTQQSDCYMASADVVVNFEGTATGYATWQANPWTSSYAAGRFWHIVYSADDVARDQAVLAARERNVGHLYVTSMSPPNPFVDLPTTSYWSALAQVVGGGAAVTATTTTTATTSTTTSTTTTTKAPSTTTAATTAGPTSTVAVTASAPSSGTSTTTAPPAPIVGAVTPAPTSITTTLPASGEFGGSGAVPSPILISRAPGAATATTVDRPTAPAATYALPPVTRPKGKAVTTTVRKATRVTTTTKRATRTTTKATTRTTVRSTKR